MTRNRLIIITIAISLLALSGNAFSQTHAKFTDDVQRAVSRAGADDVLTTWVFFADKGTNITEKLETAEAALTPRARARRLRNRGADNLVDEHDIAVNESYIGLVANKVRRIRHASRWLNAVSVETDASALSEIALMHFVNKIDLVHRSKSPSPPPQPYDTGIDLAPQPSPAYILDYGLSLTQVDQINVPVLHDLGYDGSGVLVCMLDTGFNNLGHEALDHLDILETRDFVNGDSIVGDEADMGVGNHGTYTLSALGGFHEGQLIGPAYGASFILGKTENTEWERHIEEDHWVAGAEWADSAGADILSSSLGYRDGFTHLEPNYTWQDMDGTTAITTIGAHIATTRGILVVNSAGNEGAATAPENSIIAPSDGYNVLCIGAVDASGNRVSFSSMGYSADGRVKPDVMAMGLSVRSASPSVVDAYVGVSGTSLSCPLVAGACALILEINPTWSIFDIIGSLRATASNTLTPDNSYGWGTIDAAAAAFYSTSSVEDNVPRAESTLYAAWPNPFNPTTTLRYFLASATNVSLRIYDIQGRQVRTLVNAYQPEGLKTFVWDGRNDAGAKVGSGIYFYTLRAGNERQSKKVVLLR